jgi:hypothetical protein
MAFYVACRCFRDRAGARVHAELLVEAAFFTFHRLDDAIADRVTFLHHKAGRRIVPRHAGDGNRAGQEFGQMVLGAGDCTGSADRDLQSAVFESNYPMIERRHPAA